MRLNLATLLLYGLLLAILSWMVAKPFWAYLVLGLLIATLSFPLFDWLRGKTGKPRISSIITVTVVLLIVIIPLSLITWQIVVDMRSLVAGLNVAQLSEQIETLALWTHQTFGYPQNIEQTRIEQLIAEFLPPIKARLAEWIPQAVQSIGAFLIGMIITVITAYYALFQGEAFVEQLKRASPMDDRMEGQFLEEAKMTVDGVIKGQVISAVLQGGLGYIAFFVAGIPNAIFWSFVMAILSFLPLVGAFLVWAPAAVFLLASGDTAMGVGMIVWGVLVISSVDNIVKPLIIGKESALHPLLAFIGVLGGLVAFGIMGFIMGPLVLSLFAAVFKVLAQTGWDLKRWETDLPEGQVGDQPPTQGPPVPAQGEPAAEGAD